MIDTIILSIPSHHFQITQPELFEPNAWLIWKLPLVRGISKCVQFPKKNAGYHSPSLSLVRRLLEWREIITLKIEFSIPKLVFWNNFNELTEADFWRVIHLLSEQLQKMGILTLVWTLERAMVSTIHFWKNIVFTDYTSVNSILSSISKTNVSKRFDIRRTDYDNGWEVLRFHTNSFQLIFYDKISDLKKTQRRAVEKSDRNINYQTDFFEKVRMESKRRFESFEVLRIEIRFMNKQKLRQFFTELEIECDFTFESLFRERIAKSVLNHYWDITMSELKVLSFTTLTPVDRFTLLLSQKHITSPGRLLSMLGYMELLSNESFRDIRWQFEKRFSYRTLKRLHEDIKLVESEKTFHFIDVITHNLRDLRPILMDYW